MKGMHCGGPVPLGHLHPDQFPVANFLQRLRMDPTPRNGRSAV